jgi:hypothetical protein
MTSMNLVGSRWARALRWITALATATVLAACGGGGGDSSSPVTGQGSLRVALTDAPSCGYDHVWVTVSKVSVNKSPNAAESDIGWNDLTLTPARKIDLLSLQNGVLEELGTMPLPTGQYAQVRLVLANNGGGDNFANSVQPTGGSIVALTTPSGQQSGLKLQAHFDVLAGQMADMVIDFDACKSIVKAGNSGQYILKPVLSVHERVVSGIQGFVSTTLNLNSTTVSAQQNGVSVRATNPDSTGKFTIPYLTPGNTYNLVIRSDGRATVVITSVPTSTTTTVINGTATAVLPPVSAMANVGGTVTTTSVSGSSTASLALTDASVRALQGLTGGPTIELGNQPVDAVLGSYQFRLPTAAPVKATYSTGTMTFTADAAVAGKYNIEASSPGRITQLKPADISSGTSATVNFSFSP